MARDLNKVSGALAGDPQVRRIFAGPQPDGLVGAGDLLVQLDLAQTIARLRTEGPGDIYAGDFASNLVKAAIKAGGSLERADLINAIPAWGRPIVVTGNDLAAYFPAPPPVAGPIEGQMWAMLAAGNRFGDVSADERDHLLAETAVRAFSDADRQAINETTDPQSLVSRERSEALVADYLPDQKRADAARGTPRLENPAGAGWSRRS
ncbi:MAG: hypothetical protein HC834_01235, partial [Rhodospirillales bacterium]|nr:hypothetical protein [Rhodospirillales bacterium]